MTGAPRTADASIGDLIRELALAIAHAQRALDAAALSVATWAGGRTVERDPISGAPLVDEDGAPRVVDSRVPLGRRLVTDRDGTTRIEARDLAWLELGLVPTFYSFIDTVIELKVAMRARPAGAAGGLGVTPADGRYAGLYGYPATDACALRARVVPVPEMGERARPLYGRTEAGRIGA